VYKIEGDQSHFCPLWIRLCLQSIALDCEMLVSSTFIKHVVVHFIIIVESICSSLIN
jgi:hypothetical protein